MSTAWIVAAWVAVLGVEVSRWRVARSWDRHVDDALDVAGEPGS